MQRQHETDEDVMAALQQGDRTQLSVLLRRYANSLLTFIQRACADRHQTEELFQEVWLAVWTRRHSFDATRRFRCWLFGIAAKKCQADWRRGGLLGIVNSDEARQVASNTPTPETGAAIAESAELVKRAVERLPDNQRTTVVLRVWNGLSYAEIADVMGVAEGTVRSHMFHALKSMRKYLEPRLS